MISDRLFLRKFVFYVLFRICVGTDFVDFEEFCGLMIFVQNKLEMD